MEKSERSNRYSPEMRARAVRMALEHQGSYETQGAAVAAIAPKTGCIPETLKVWVRQAERDSGARDGATSPSGTGSRNWNVKFDSFAKPMKSCARRPHGLLRRNSTARSSHDQFP
jgi:transposase-like protein